MEKIEKVYTVHAFRFGDRERHSYIVGVYSTEGLATGAAEVEMDYRGGKYVCEVIEWPLDLHPTLNAYPGARVVLALPGVKE